MKEERQKNLCEWSAPLLILIHLNTLLEEYKKILKEEGLSGKEIADLIDITYGSYRSATRKQNQEPPKWVRVAILFYKLGKKDY